jgi:hypothetical protein
MELAAGLTYVCLARTVEDVMRTTIRLNDRLAARVRAYTRRTNQTFTRLVEEALEAMLAKRNGPPRSLPKLPVVHGKTKLTHEQLQAAIDEQQLEDDLRSLGLKRCARCST